MSYSLCDFVAESNRIEGISYTSAIQIAAHETFLQLKTVTVTDLEIFVVAVQPGAILRREAHQNVRVGNHIAPQGGTSLVEELVKLLKNMHHNMPYETHVAYEQLHPFTDGNGRSGRVLWLWCMRGEAPIGFLHQFYYQTLAASRH